MPELAQKTVAVPQIGEAAGRKRTVTMQEIIIDIASIPAILILFVIAMLYAGILFLFRVK